MSVTLEKKRTLLPFAPIVQAKKLKQLKLLEAENDEISQLIEIKSKSKSPRKGPFSAQSAAPAALAGLSTANTAMAAPTTTTGGGAAVASTAHVGNAVLGLQFAGADIAPSSVVPRAELTRSPTGGVPWRASPPVAAGHAACTSGEMAARQAKHTLNAGLSEHKTKAAATGLQDLHWQNNTATRLRDEATDEATAQDDSETSDTGDTDDETVSFEETKFQTPMLMEVLEEDGEWAACSVFTHLVDRHVVIWFGDDVYEGLEGTYFWDEQNVLRDNDHDEVKLRNATPGTVTAASGDSNSPEPDVNLCPSDQSTESALTATSPPFANAQTTAAPLHDMARPLSAKRKSPKPAGTKAQGAAAHTPGAAAATDKTAAAGVAPGSATPQQHGVPDNAGGVQGLAHNNAGAGDTPPIKKASPAQGATGTPGEKLAAKQNERARLVHGWVKQRLASGASIVGKQEDRDDFTARTGVGVSSFNKWMRKAGLQYNQSAGCWGKPKSTLGGAHTSKPDPSLPSTPGLAPGTVAALGTKATPSTAQSMARAPEPGGPANGQTQGGSHGSDLAVQDRLDTIEYWKRKGLDLSGVPGVIVEQKPPGAPGQASKKPGLYPTTLLGATSKHPRERYVEQEKKDCKYVADDCNNLACPNGNHADGEVNRIRMRRYKAMVAVNGRHPTPEVNPAAGFFEFSRAKRSTWTKGCSDTFRTKGGLQEHLKKCEFGSAPASAKKRASSKAKAAAGRNDPAAASGARGGGAAVAANPVGFLPSADHGSRPSPGEEHGAFGAQDAVPPRLALPAAATARTSLPQGELQQADLSPAKTAMLLD